MKEAVLGAESNSSEANSRMRESVRDAERRNWWTSGSDLSSRAAEIGRNVEKTAVKAEHDVKTRAETLGKNMTDTARKAYDNVIDAATTVDGQSQHSHHHHEHGTGSGHHFYDHIRDDLRQTKNDLQNEMGHLKDAVFGAEQAADKAANQASANVQQAAEEGKRWWNAKSTTVSGEINKAATETKHWWSAKNHETEKTANRLDSELRAGLNKAGDKIREMDRGLDETLNRMAGREASDDYWFHAEQNRQQSRGSGRAM